AHELIVVRESGSRLPLRRDGSTVSEEKLDSVTAGVLEPGQPGSNRQLRLHLPPGRYVLFCNMSGHYLGGMHSELVVGWGAAGGGRSARPRNGGGPGRC